MIRIKQFKHFFLLVSCSLAVLLNISCFLLIYCLDKNMLYIRCMIVLFILQSLTVLYLYFIFGSKHDLFITKDGVFINNTKTYDNEDLISVETVANYRYKLTFKCDEQLNEYDVFLAKKQYEYLKK